MLTFPLFPFLPKLHALYVPKHANAGVDSANAQGVVKLAFNRSSSMGFGVPNQLIWLMDGSLITKLMYTALLLKQLLLK